MSNEKKKEYKLDWANKDLLGQVWEDKYGGFSFSFLGGKISIQKAQSGKAYAYFVRSIKVDDNQSEMTDSDKQAITDMANNPEDIPF